MMWRRCCCCWCRFHPFQSVSFWLICNHPFALPSLTLSCRLTFILAIDVTILLHVHFSNSSSSASLSIRLSAQCFHPNQRIMCVCLCQRAKRKRNIESICIYNARKKESLDRIKWKVFKPSVWVLLLFFILDSSFAHIPLSFSSQLSLSLSRSRLLLPLNISWNEALKLRAWYCCRFFLCVCVYMLVTFLMANGT